MEGLQFHCSPPGAKCLATPLGVDLAKIVGRKTKIVWEKKAGKSDKCMGNSKLLGGTCPGCTLSLRLWTIVIRIISCLSPLGPTHCLNLLIGSASTCKSPRLSLRTMGRLGSIYNFKWRYTNAITYFTSFRSRALLTSLIFF